MRKLICLVGKNLEMKRWEDRVRWMFLGALSKMAVVMEGGRETAGFIVRKLWTTNRAKTALSEESKESTMALTKVRPS